MNVRVGISYVSLANARANLDAEKPAGRPSKACSGAARDAWNTALGAHRDHRRHRDRAPHLLHRALPLAVAPERRPATSTASTAASTARSTVVRRAAAAQYANFSGWDVYRSQLQLVALLEPKIGGDMAQSLLNQAAQNNGVWDRWTHNTGATDVMTGDPSAAAGRVDRRVRRDRLRHERRRSRR